MPMDGQGCGIGNVTGIGKCSLEGNKEINAKFKEDPEGHNLG